MVFTINTIVYLNVYSIVHNMVYTFMIRVMDINVVMVIIIHVIVLAHHLAIRRDLILISVIIKEALQEIIAFPLITIHIMLINVQILLEMMVWYQQDISINHHQHQKHVYKTVDNIMLNQQMKKLHVYQIVQHQLTIMFKHNK